MKKLGYAFLICVLLGGVKVVEAKSYQIDTIKYEESSSSNSSLKSLTIEGVNFNFKPDILDYELEVPYNMKSLKITYEPYIEGSIVEVVGGEELFLGNNSIAIIVTSGYDGSVSEYDLTVVRKDDITETDNHYNSIENELSAGNSSIVSVDVSEDATLLPVSTSEILKRTSKSIVFNWKDVTGKVLATLSMNGDKIKNVDKIDPNVKHKITDDRLKKYVENYEYTPISTKGTNIPEGSTYRIAIDGNEDIYYLYYYDDNDKLAKVPLRNLGGAVEFELKDGYDYALMVSAAHPSNSSSSKRTNWVLPSILVTVLVIVVFLFTKFIMVKVLRVQSVPTEEDLKTDKKNE